MDRIWFSVFIAWVFKACGLRFGGAWFIGLALGQIVAGGLWLLVDAFTGKVGNVTRVY